MGYSVPVGGVSETKRLRLSLKVDGCKPLNDGFTIFLDVNLDQTAATRLLEYMKDAYFVDEKTSTLSAGAYTRPLFNSM